MNKKYLGDDEKWQEKKLFVIFTEGLTNITIPEGVTTIGECAFGGCKKKNLTLKGLFGSYAEMYAKKNGIPFETIE